MYHMIANPSARSGSSTAPVREHLEQALKQYEIPYTLEYTRAPGHAMELARKFSLEENAVLIVLGGDGTINEAINGIQDFTKTRIGFLPTGSSNDLARGLKLPDLHERPMEEELIQHICQGKVLRTMDLGRVQYDDHLELSARMFAISAGIGYDAAICEEAQHSGIKKFFNRLHQGKLSYGVIGAKELFTAPSARCSITVDSGQTFSSEKMLFSAIMNTPYEGGGYQFAPDAAEDDGLLNLVMIGDIAKLNALIHFPSAHQGKYYHVKGVRHAMAKKIHITTSVPLWVHTDGEVRTRSTSITVSVLPHCLQLIV